MKTITEMTVGELVAAGHHVSIQVNGLNNELRLRLTESQKMEAVQSLSVDGSAIKGFSKDFHSGARSESRGVWVYV